ncbi:hypothetical protein E1B28_002801 [Marasmius oreades]|uniref:Extracellular metalloproteinase n=1 Tax=Marasmius oreades TaxID=181124 RepID=A0A9P7UNF7_9AGAR|nr:uncharacterized protein E1B28_002801 [Marasmius oreades]KAG7086881.1 hypothetical protein E1B28_002801 [Marasmius oreades]
MVMVAKFNNLFTSVFIAVLYASGSYTMGMVAATPMYSTDSGHGRESTSYHGHVRSVGDGRVKIKVYHPESVYTIYGEGMDVPSSFVEMGIENKTVSFVSSKLGLDIEKVGFKSGFSTSAQGGTFGYARQMHDGIPFVNAVANVAFKDNKVVAFGQSFVDTSNIADSKPSVDVSSVVTSVETTLQGKMLNEVPPSLGYLARDDGSVALVHIFQVQNRDAHTWYEAYVDAHSGGLLSVTDFVADASYKVIPVWKQDLTEGFETLIDPQLASASPKGWHDNNATAGNNVLVYKGPETNTTVQSSEIDAPPLTFAYTFDPELSPSDGPNVDVARTNAFYLMNSWHDTLYEYGFTESAFNFQNDNFGKGGVGGDRVLLSVQDGSGVDNANFATPPDGQSGQCRMFIWDETNPNRDGALENDIPIHEMTHGLTNRMTGGGTGSCLQIFEAVGMGEGWSDAVADWFAHSDSPEITDFVLGAYVTNNPAGIRTKPYSTSMTTNGYRYSDIANMNDVHDVGEVWANILHNLYAELVGAHGFSDTARTSAQGTEGNIVFLQLLVDALPLQPCNPLFYTGRDAIIQADANRYGGANRCLLWKVFASRGVGVGAKNRRDSMDVPDDC